MALMRSRHPLRPGAVGFDPKVRYRWMRCGCRIEVIRKQDEELFYHQRHVDCHKPHHFTRQMLKAWARRYDERVADGSNLLDRVR